MIFDKVLIVDPVRGNMTGRVEIENHIISAVVPQNGDPDFILMPGFVDLHTHAQKGIDTMYAGQEEYIQWAQNNFEQGVTTFLPTTVSASIETLEKILGKADRLPLSIDGIHLEGPFINPVKKGAQNAAFIFPSKRRDLSRIIKAPVKLITAAPEVDGFDTLYEVCLQEDVTVSLGHSTAGYTEMKHAYEMGVRKITHFPNALTPLLHREIGATGAGLYMDFDIEMIVDGIHTSPEFVDLVYRIKGADRIFLITDSMAAAGMPDGEYELGGLTVYVNGGKAVLKDGTLAGSTLLFIDGVRNFHRYTRCSYEELVKVSSWNSLKQLKRDDTVGRIEEGYLANLVLLDKNLRLLKTVFQGELVYSTMTR
jgi:N-acetylglucosamine-6-phosphate deacetylase